MDGIVNIFKEKGYTSHDVVARLRGITGQRRVGHTGTLDPDAEGVLPVCLGNATKVCDILTDKSKVYETVLLLGIATDTQDTSGAPVKSGDTAGISDEALTEAINSFVGEYEQEPPMYSALRVNGKRLYELARQGETVERRKRNVNIISIERISEIERGILRDEKLPEFISESSLKNVYGCGSSSREEGHWYRESSSISESEYGGHSVIRVALRICCSKGTYIRTLCNDIGERLGCFGCMEKLLRTRVGDFRVEESIKLADVERLHSQGMLEENLKAPDLCFEDYERLFTKEKYDSVLFNGNELRLRHFQKYIEVPSPKIRAYNSKGQFLAVYEWDEKWQKYRPLKMFR